MSRDHMNVPPAPILTLDEAAQLAAAQRAAGRVVVMTHGVFDLMHPGHIRFLEAARAEGDVLIVAVASDRTVRENKGRSRPILPEAERAELLAALASVDAVFIADEPASAIAAQHIKPDVFLESARLNVPGYSTSALIDRVNASR
jgi:rfaE bifunctional protein nucleotidyltransferase chain/domain